MATSGNIANTDSTTQLLNLIGAFKGQNSSSTTSPNISAQGMNAVLQQILGSANGLAAVSGASKSAGLYNSPTQTLLTNDYVTRTAGELAKQQAGSTTKTSKAPLVSGNNILGLLGVAAGKSLFGPAISGGLKKTGVDQWGNKIADTVGLGSGGANASVDSAGTNLFSSDTAGSYANVGGLADSLSGLGSDVGSDLTVDTAGVGIDAAGQGLSQAADSAAADAGGSVLTDVAEDEGGSFLGSLFG